MANFHINTELVMFSDIHVLFAGSRKQESRTCHDVTDAIIYTSTYFTREGIVIV